VTRQLVVQMVVTGVALGSIYMLMSAGLTLIYGIMHQVNMAHGVFFMLGAMLVYYATEVLGLPYFVALLLVLAVFPVIGVLFERVIFRSIRHIWLAGYMATIGVWILVEGLGWQLFGTTQKAVSFPIRGLIHLPGGATLPINKLVVGLIAIAIIVGVYVIVGRTSLGRQLRAVEQNPRAAQLVGINSDRAVALGFALGVTLAALAGGLVSTLYSIDPACGDTPMLKAFIIIILGGLGNVTGSVIASYMLGFIDSFGGTLLGPQAGHFFGFALVIAILIFKPSGIMGHE
jgi:branched-chain amino acid transport system permease protein